MKQIIINNYIISEPIENILEKIKLNVTNGKLKSIKVKSSWITVTCPFHAEGLESNPSAGIFVGEGDEFDYGSFNCFTCGEHGDFIRFVAGCFDETYGWAKSWLIRNFGVRKEDLNLELEPIRLSKSRTKDVIDKNILKTYQSWHPYMDKRNLNRNICELFEVKYDPKSECLVFPVYDEYDDLVMLTRRSVKNKMFLIDKDKEKPIYLLNYIKKNNIKEATLCESQINCLTLWGWHIPSIASFGCNITEKQVSALNKSGITHLYICYDGDNAGRHGTEKLLKLLSKNIMIDVIVMKDGKDVNDLTEEQFNQLIILSGEDWLLKYGK